MTDQNERDELREQAPAVNQAVDTGSEEDDFAALLDQHLPDEAPKQRGELIDATVVGILDDSVLVDYGSKEESPIAIDEFRTPSGDLMVAVGDRIRVVMTGWRGAGLAELSFKAARAAEARKMVEEAGKANRPVRGVVSRAVKGGVLVDIGMDAFMPASQVDIFRVGDLESLVGQEIEAYVLEYNAQRGRAVLSRRKLLEERREAGRAEFFSKISGGDTLTGTVKDVLDFGVFVSLEGGIEGLIPRSEVSWDRGVHPKDVLKPGEEVEIKVLDTNPDTGKITLSRKRLGQDPWETIDFLYPVGASVNGTVVAIQGFGAFVQLTEGITGLIHASDISWESGQKNPADEFRIGDTVTCQVLEIDHEKKRLALSLKHLARDPWTSITDKFPEGSEVTGTVTGLRPFGAFVKLDEFAEGLLHVSDMSWEKRINHPKELLEEGQELKVKVLALDREKRRISLGLKQLEDSPWAKFAKEHRENSVTTGKVTKLAPFGAFVELAPGIEGLVHISELSEQRIESPEKAVSVGQEIEVKILKIEQRKGRISLSRKGAIKQAERDNIRQYMKQEDKKSVGNTLGDMLKQAMQDKE